MKQNQLKLKLLNEKEKSIYHYKPEFIHIKGENNKENKKLI